MKESIGLPQKKTASEKSKNRSRALLIASGNEIYRSSILSLLKKHFPNISAVEANNSETVFSLLNKKQIDLVLYDIALSGASWPSTLQELVTFDSGVPRIFVLNSGLDDTAVWRALKMGACAYVSPKDTEEGLVHGVERVLSGKKYISSFLLAEVAYYVADGDGRLPHEKLSTREYEVLCRLGSGKSVSQAARDMRLSVKTVSTFRARILEKMSLKTNEELIRYVVSHHLVP